jgi:hypothetical protein
MAHPDGSCTPAALSSMWLLALITGDWLAEDDWLSRHMYACRATMSYLQVICEQHRLVEQHLDMFANPPGDAATQSKKVSHHEHAPSPCPSSQPSGNKLTRQAPSPAGHCQTQRRYAWDRFMSGWMHLSVATLLIPYMCCSSVCVLQPPPKDPSQLPSFASSRVTLAASTGILDLVRCATEAALRDAQALQAVYVADLRHNK